VDGVRFIETMMTHPIDKDAAADALAPLRQVFNKSVVPRVDLPAGLVLCPEHLALKKPGTGIPAGRLSELVGRRTKRDLRMDELMRDEDLERPVGS
jgi:N-acetylneuraminate synthase